MSVLIFRLNDVPEDEAADVRQLLDAHGLAYHETSGGFLGLRVAGLWLLDRSRKAEARALIDAYQADRAARIGAEHASLRASGQLDTTLTRLLRQPLQSLLYLLGAAAVLWIVLSPFFALIP